ncbi:hypothetical protein OTU49_014132, partial [Cherax quadricarinatus]
ATLSPESVIEVVESSGAPLYLDPHVLAPVVSGIACTLALLLCVGLLVSRGRARFVKSESGPSGDGATATRGPKYPHSLAELQNHRNDSQEQLSPAAKAKQEEAYTEIACISSQQTLPISSVGLRGRTCKRGKAGEEGQGSDSEQDNSGSPGHTPAHGLP